ncbi:MAG TPA: GIY-YIG nuclease family protein [Solirubrobacterales bacterium]|nr:GIY-YIG nuclease family protein [Solirubrobacterales bacterium]
MTLGGPARPIGSTISLYLAEGQPAGVRIVQKDNWSGIGIDCSRADLAQARKREEFARSGVYLLVGDQDEAGGLPTLYVGEADELGPRLATHSTNKDFWNRLVIFTSKDGMINKAHARHLESRLFQIASEAKRCHLENKVPPGLPQLGDQDRDLAERFLGEMLVVLPVIGISAFELPKSDQATGLPNLFLKGKAAQGRGMESSQGFKVLAGSVARPEEVDSIHGWTHELRSDLLENGVLKRTEQGLTFTQDYVFKSPSAAAAVLMGRSANGREEWRDADGKTLKQIQEEALDSPPSGELD